MAKMMNKVQTQSEIGVLFISQDIPLEHIKNDFKAYLNSLKKNRTEFKMKNIFAVINGQLYSLY